MLKLKVLSLLFLFLFNFTEAQTTKLDYENFVKNGVVLSTYLHLNENDKMYKYLEKIDYIYYDKDVENIVFFHNLQDPLSGLLSIKILADGSKQLTLRVKKDVFDFKFELYSAMERSFPYNTWNQLMNSVKDLPSFIKEDYRTFSYIENNEREVYQTSNFSGSPMDKNQVVTMFRTPNGGFIFISYSEKWITFITKDIVNDLWIDDFLNKGLNETIWFKN